MADRSAFEIAEQKIEEACRTRVTELDLSYRLVATDSKKLAGKLESLGRLSWLQSLNLSHNQLKVLPEPLGQLTELQSLDVSHNQLIDLPEWLSQLKQLHSLNLFANQLTALPEWVGQLTQLQSLDLAANRLKELPEWLGGLARLQFLRLSNNQLMVLPEWLGQLTQLRSLNLFATHLTVLPESLSQLEQLRYLDLYYNKLEISPNSLGKLMQLENLRIDSPHGIFPNVRSASSLQEISVENLGLTSLPDWIGELVHLTALRARNNAISDLPASLAALPRLSELTLGENPLNLELAAAYREGLDAVKRYLRAKAEAQIPLNEAKLIVVGEGEVGKSCLLGALRGDPWEEGRPTTHGIEIKQVSVTDPETGTEITLNGWDFGGQRVYRPTHQLFFTAPAVYLVVWKSRGKVPSRASSRSGSSW
jgi:Leucine-rich repeat (LRR) protein